ncbi:unnamed protein product [Symbiodinium pilosum]|uniref:Uncharacterized protein n=1 Tax=Symbiodinium pilosum TaxID=2952 RepID=A0A812IV71_SYMPI|nr:unnamed protein product [Symbiodinium pilosum]
MDQDNHEPNLQHLVQMVAQLGLRHEDQLQLVRQDTGFVLFLRIQTPLSVLPQLHQVGQTWGQQKDKDPSSPGLPLRVVLLGSFLTALKTRVEKVMTDPQAAGDSKNAQILTDKGHFAFLGYDRAGMPNVEPTPPQDTCRAITKLQELILRPRLEAYEILSQMVHSAAIHLVGGHLHFERIQRSPLAQALDKAVR